MSIKDSLLMLKQADLCALFAVTDRTIQRWHDQGLPRHGEGRGCYYVWADVLPWYLRFMSGSKGGGEDGNTDSERQERAEADIAEMKRDQLARSLVSAQEMQAAEVDLFTRLRSNLRGFPRRLIDRLEGAEDLRERLAIGKQEMEATLRELSALLDDKEDAS